MLSKLSLILTLGKVVTAANDAWILSELSSLAFARMDPIIAPGAVSGHVHNIMGGSCFSQNINTPQQQQDCACTTAVLGADKSNYWSPALYYRTTDDKYQPILNANRIYYYIKGADPKPFPPGLRMISGQAVTRNNTNPVSKGLMISCDHGEQTSFLPNSTSHPGGCKAISMGIFFPSCGLASGDLDAPDHFSHMAWAQSYDGDDLVDDPNGAYCPDSHPIKYPTIFFEANYYLGSWQPWRNEENLLLLATGDTTGNAYHADYFNGWDQQVLADGIKQCGNGKAPGTSLGKCAPFAPSFNVDTSRECRLQSKIPDEDVGFFKPLDALPGCNKLWTADMPDVKPECVETNPPEFVYPNVMYNSLLMNNHIPMAFTEVNDSISATDLKYDFLPALGTKDQAHLLPWGGQVGDDAVNLKVGLLDELLAGTPGSEPASTAAASSAAVASSTDVASSPSSTQVSAIAGGAVALATGDAEPSSTSSSQTATATVVFDAATSTKAKTCKRKKRGVLEGHNSRRSRRSFFDGHA